MFKLGHIVLFTGLAPQITKPVDDGFAVFVVNVTSVSWCTLPCKAKRQYLFTCKVSRYCLLALKGSNSIYANSSELLPPV